MALSTLTLRRWHRRFALILGGFFLIQGLTGAISQQRFWLMQQLDPAFYRVASGGKALAPAELLALLAREKPDFNVAHVMYPAAVSPRTAVIVMGGPSADAADMSRMVTIDQYQGEVIGERSTMSGWIGIAVFLHRWALFGVPGRIFLTLLGLGVMVFSALGLVIWWRTRAAGQHARGVVRVHRTAGVVAGLFIVSVAATGTLLNLLTWAEVASGRSAFKNNMEVSGGAHGHAAHTVSAGDIDRAWELARRTVGDWHLAAFSPAGAHARHHWFAFMDRRLQRVDVLVDAGSGELVGVYPTGLTEGGEGLRSWLFPVHSGYIIGPVGGLLYSLIGVSVSLWLVTGFVMWRRQRSRR